MLMSTLHHSIHAFRLTSSPLKEKDMNSQRLGSTCVRHHKTSNWTRPERDADLGAEDECMLVESISMPWRSDARSSAMRRRYLMPWKADTLGGWRWTSMDAGMTCYTCEKWPHPSKSSISMLSPGRHLPSGPDLLYSFCKNA